MTMIDPLAPDMNLIEQSLKKELSFIWAAHQKLSLDGYMAVYTEDNQEPWRAKTEGQIFWFGASENDIDEAIAFIKQHYNNGALPNSTLLLNPVVHSKEADGSYKAIGSGIAWGTSLTLGVAKMADDQQRRITELGVLNSRIHRAENKNAGLKMVAISNKILPANPDGKTVTGCKDLYELTDIHSDPYAPYYMLSGLNYLCLHGVFCHPGIDDIIAENERNLPASEIATNHEIDHQTILDANRCWNSYDRQDVLYRRFGVDTKDIERNNKYYDLCARDLHLFDRTGPLREGADESFEFIVPGYIPRGAVTLLAAPGGTGKSSVAHQLCVLASMDLKEGDEQPLWLGQPVNMEFCKDGICVYFSGEDGPAILNARGNLFDPDGRSQRLQFHRSEFVDQEISFSAYLSKLQKMPNVPIVVIDPARKYLSGDEDDSDVVSEFFEAIEDFAISKKCAVIVVHHLQKGANPKSSRDVLDELRGSQVFIDRPRVVLGMYRDGPYTGVGLAKNNIPPNLGMVREERIFARNPKNLQLIWLPGEEGVRKDELSEDELQELEAETMRQLAAKNQ